MKVTFGEVMEEFKGLLQSGPANAAMKISKYGSKAGQFFGWVDPKTKNMIDIASAIQDYSENKMTRTDLEDKGVQDVANWLIAAKLEKSPKEGGWGWSPEMATLAAGIGSKVLGFLAKPAINLADKEISKVVEHMQGQVTPGGQSTGNSLTTLVSSELHKAARAAAAGNA